MFASEKLCTACGAVRLDPRLAPRVDPSDVVQEALVEAARKLPQYAAHRPLPFYPWLRQIAWERLVHVHTRHVTTQKRSVTRERRGDWGLSDQSAAQLADRLVAGGSSPSERLLRREMHERVHAALDQLPTRDREVLVLWYLEHLSTGEIAAVIGLTQAGVKSRHRRALERLLGVLGDDVSEEQQ